MENIVIVDYGMGNLFSVKKVIERLGFTCKVTGLAEDIKKASKLILPGVGHFGKAMSNLKNNGLFDELNEAVLHHHIPVLGICLGMQLMAAHSEEGETKGLNWFDADVVKFNIGNRELFKVPHVGWNKITHEKESPIWKNINEEDEFYFVHSYHIIPNSRPDVLSKTRYEYPFVSSISKENIFGMQFHPEKSHIAGEQLINNFLNH